MTQPVNHPLILWGVDASPYVRKVRVVLEEKAIPYEQRETLPVVLLNALGKPVPAEFAACSPLGKIPAISHGNYMLSDSAAICAYLERKYPEGRHLYLSTPEEYGRAIWLENYANEHMNKVIHQGIFVPVFVKRHVLGQQPDQAAVDTVVDEQLPPMFDYLQRQLGGSDWLAGSRFSIADISVAVHFVSLRLCEVNWDETRWPKLAEYVHRVLSRPSFELVLD